MAESNEVIYAPGKFGPPRPLMLNSVSDFDHSLRQSANPALNGKFLPVKTTFIGRFIRISPGLKHSLSRPGPRIFALSGLPWPVRSESSRIKAICCGLVLGSLNIGDRSIDRVESFFGEAGKKIARFR